MNKKDKEDELLSQLIIDLDLKDAMDGAFRDSGTLNYPPPAEDELSYGLRKLREKGAINVCFVFAARIFLGLHEILGEQITRGRDEQRVIARNIDFLVASTGTFSQGRDAIRWPSKEDDAVKKLNETCYSVLKFTFPPFKEEMNNENEKEDNGELGLEFCASSCRNARLDSC